MEITMTNLEETFKVAVDKGIAYVGVAIGLEGSPGKEVIITPRENLISKLAYYKRTYDGNLKHKFSEEGIRIVGATYGDNFDEIERDLIG